MANYMIFYEKTIENNFKFQIGKRYKINSDLCKNGLTFFKSFGEIEKMSTSIPQTLDCG